MRCTSNALFLPSVSRWPCRLKQGVPNHTALCAAGMVGVLRALGHAQPLAWAARLLYVQSAQVRGLVVCLPHAFACPCAVEAHGACVLHAHESSRRAPAQVSISMPQRHSATQPGPSRPSTLHASSLFASPCPPQLSSLVLVEHQGGAVAGCTLNTLGAAVQLGAPVTALVAGKGPGVGSAAASVAGVKGVEKVGMHLGGMQHDRLLQGLCRRRHCRGASLHLPCQGALGGMHGHEVNKQLAIKCCIRCA